VIGKYFISVGGFFFQNASIKLHFQLYVCKYSGRRLILSLRDNKKVITTTNRLHKTAIFCTFGITGLGIFDNNSSIHDSIKLWENWLINRTLISNKTLRPHKKIHRSVSTHSCHAFTPTWLDWSKKKKSPNKKKIRLNCHHDRKRKRKK